MQYISPHFNSSKTIKEHPQEPLRFVISHAHLCPYYSIGDLFELDRNGIVPPPTKPICFQLATTFKEKMNILEKHRAKSSVESFLCGGCKENSHSTLTSFSTPIHSPEIQILIRALHQYSFFRLIPEPIMTRLYDEFVIHTFDPGVTILQKGTVSSAMFMVISGEVEMLVGSGDVSIGHHGPGGIFGEMSIICDAVHTATIRTTKPTRVLEIKEKTFNGLIVQFPSLQRYFYRLLAKRLNRLNLFIAKSDFVEMHGKLSEWPLPDLLQTINMNHKTGTIELTFEHSTATVEFFNGNITGASFRDLVGSEAFYALFTESEGTFNFIHTDPSSLGEDRSFAVLGDFMSMIMEGLVRADELKS